MYYRKISKLVISFLITAVMCSSIFSVNFAADTKSIEAKFEISNITPALNEVVTFDASASTAAEGGEGEKGEIVSYEWDFEDGSSADGAIVTRSFAETDDYNVILTVKDSNGNMAFKKKKIFVGRPQGWTEKTHSKSADPDYGLLFPDDKVLRIDIKMSPDNYQKIKTDLQNIFANIPQFPVGQIPSFPEGGIPQFPGGEMPPIPGGGIPPFPEGEWPDIPGMDFQDPIYVPVTVSYNGNTWFKVGFRYKGNSSLMSLRDKTKLPFRLNFDKFEDENPEVNNQRFYGFSSMTFGNCWNDNSFMREKVAGEVFREGGVPAAKSSFCRVYVDTGNGPKYWGLYTMTEDPSDAMLKDQFGNAKGNCYKPEGAGASWTSPFIEEAFIKENNEEDADWGDVQSAHEALFADNTDKEVWRSNLEKYFNVRGFLKWLAINTAMVNWDSYGIMAHNYYLYNDKDKGLTWIAWDHNLSMSKGIMGKVLSLSLNEVTDKWPLIRKLLDDPVYNNLYHYEMRKVIKGCMNADKISSKVKAYQTLIKPYVVGEEGETNDATLLVGGEAAFNSACDGIINHIISRQKEVNEYLKTVSITPPSPKVTFKQVDLNHDDIINMDDIIIMAKAFNTAKGHESYNAACDFNEDGCINLLDIAVISKMFGQNKD
ncbi:CotH kinase family protein [Pseudobacteroides cellulosolvens]|uniref:Spore coat protein CotH n=1 Tax=Pseudobacteroides cellulosolvens ATCC 35603 = DSM 2933 TaxID=398512 RepID=A0A0L6JWW0_9FIRM|nr:CotH kinase family protein [Pseudobacteroides cellulosolvens]KNY30346.1 Spore coat protein CotH [Pseudobacteroides cellulosolvens ATCC 35603 = DSM 2933]